MNLDMEHSSQKVKILFLAANPIDTERLRLDEEIRSIDEAVQKARFRDLFDIEQQWAVKVGDLQDFLLRYEPDVIHFSGHGSAVGEIVLEDDSGNARPVSAKALSNLFRLFKDKISVVVFNACYSKPQAKAIAKHIPCVIGMSASIGDKAAIRFAAAFYQAIGYRQSVQQAFDLGCNQIELENLEEQDTPVLLKAPGINASSVVLGGREESLPKA
jgi:hypothetical protein